MTYRIWTRVAFVFVLGILPTAVRSAEPTYVQHKDVVYADEHGVGLLMDIFVPKGEKNGHGIVDVASGAWHSDRGKIRDHERAQFYQIMCGKGFTVFAVRPGSITKFSGQEMLANLNAGIRWVKAHAAEYGINPDELGLTGASAGGHLATLAMVTADEKTRVKAVAVFFPPTDFLDWGGKPRELASGGRGNGVMRALAFPPGQAEGKKPEEMAAALKAISPALLVKPGLPPYLTIHGDADPAVPLQQSQKMVAALKAAGDSAELIVKPGGGHPWPTINEEVAVIADWFVKHLVGKKAS